MTDASQYDAVLVANGSQPSKTLFQKVVALAPRLIAVDGGLASCLRFEHTPTALIGDLDSITPRDLAWAKRRKVRILRRRSPHSTDLQKAMVYCASRNWTKLAILAASGDRPDHYLNGLDLAFKYRKLKPHYYMSKSHVLPLSGRTTIERDLAPGHTVSWLGFPFAGGCTFEGVRWSFRARTLSSGGFQSVSNVSQGPIRARQQRGRSILVISLRPDN